MSLLTVMRSRTGITPFNMLTANQASAETSAAGWTTSSVFASNCTIAQLAATAQHGSNVIRQLANFTTASMSFECVPRDPTGIPVSPNTQYTASAYVKLIAGDVGDAAQVTIRWLNSGGTEISESTTSQSVTLSSSFQRTHSTATSPATAAYAVIRCTKSNGVTNGVDDCHWDAFMFNQGSLVTFAMPS